MAKIFPEDEFEHYLYDAKKIFIGFGGVFWSRYINKVNEILSENGLTEQDFENYITQCGEIYTEDYWGDDRFDCGCCTCCGCTCDEDENY